jgi:hypothetical protein
MLDRPIAYFQSLTLLQKLSLLGVAGSVATLAGSAIAYDYMPRFAEMIEDNRNVAIIATAALAAPLLGYSVPFINEYVPQQLKLPSYGAIHMGAIGMRPNPIAMGSAHALNGIAMSGAHMGALHMGALHMGALSY